ncbi:MAG: hypothetical protein HQM14_05485, partial [SAR324 cluster bacterium]|nr:hypothetical protein [SAR324 cluster bacterium]
MNTTETLDPPAGTFASESTPVLHQENAEKIVKKYILLSGGAGLIPIPLFDQIVIGSL